MSLAEKGFSLLDREAVRSLDPRQIVRRLLPAAR
jgi:hypothetical protein